MPLAWCSDDITSYRAALNGGVANTQEICFEYRVSSLTISNNESQETIQLKVQSLLELRKWLGRMIKGINLKNKSHGLDIQYNNFIRSHINNYISKEIAYWALKDIKPNTLRILYWLRFFYSNSLSVQIMLRDYFSFLYHKWIK